MFSTTLRIPDDLAVFLQQAARADAVSVNAFLAGLLERERRAARKRQLAKDWEAYAAEGNAQDVEWALPAQAEIAAEEPIPYRTGPRPAGGTRRKKK